MKRSAAVAAVFATTIVLINFLVDLTYSILDPRIRISGDN